MHDLLLTFFNSLNNPSNGQRSDVMQKLHRNLMERTITDATWRLMHAHKLPFEGTVRVMLYFLPTYMYHMKNFWEA